MSRLDQARNWSEAYWTLDPFAVVRPGDPWFTDLERLVPREHYGVAHRLKKQFAVGAGRPDFVHVDAHLEAVRNWFADEVLVETHRDQILGIRSKLERL
jgi:hypothetical protein